MAHGNQTKPKSTSVLLSYMRKAPVTSPHLHSNEIKALKRGSANEMKSQEFTREHSGKHFVYSEMSAGSGALVFLLGLI